MTMNMIHIVEYIVKELQSKCVFVHYLVSSYYIIGLGGLPIVDKLSYIASRELTIEVVYVVLSTGCQRYSTCGLAQSIRCLFCRGVLEYEL